MSAAEKQYTGRDLVLAKREGFYAGSAWRWEHDRPHTREGDGEGITHFEQKKAAEHFPLPTIIRPREIRDPHNPNYGFDHIDFYWSIRHGQMHIGHKLNGAMRWNSLSMSTMWVLKNPTLTRLAVWADLLANPTEEVDDDGSPHPEGSETDA